MGSLNKNAWDIEQQILGICYSMPSITWSDAWTMSALQREAAIKYINRRVEEHNKAMGH